MRRLNTALAALALATLTLAILPTNADEGLDDQNLFVKMCDKAPDGKVTKAEVMRKVEQMFDKHDTRKEGKLDKKQVQIFLKELTRQSGG